MRAAPSDIACPNSRRAHASATKRPGDSTGPVGVLPASGLRPANASTLETSPLTTAAGFGASGALATIGEASAEGSGVTDSVDNSCVGPGGGGDSLSGSSLTSRDLFQGEFGHCNPVT